jgi:hypothetical protein
MLQNYDTTITNNLLLLWKRAVASYVCKYNCNIYGEKLSVTISEFVQCKYGKNIQQVGMETFVIVKNPGTSNSTVPNVHILLIFGSCMCTLSPRTQIQMQPYKSQEIIIFGPSNHNDYMYHPLSLFKPFGPKACIYVHMILRIDFDYIPDEQ